MIIVVVLLIIFFWVMFDATSTKHHPKTFKELEMKSYSHVLAHKTADKCMEDVNSILSDKLKWFPYYMWTWEQNKKVNHDKINESKEKIYSEIYKKVSDKIANPDFFEKEEWKYDILSIINSEIIIEAYDVENFILFGLNCDIELLPDREKIVELLYFKLKNNELSIDVFSLSDVNYHKVQYEIAKIISSKYCNDAKVEFIPQDYEHKFKK